MINKLNYSSNIFAELWSLTKKQRLSVLIWKLVCVCLYDGLCESWVDLWEECMCVSVCVICLLSMARINDTPFSCLCHWMISPFTDNVRAIYCRRPDAWSMSADLVSHREAKWCESVCVENSDMRETGRQTESLEVRWKRESAEAQSEIRWKPTGLSPSQLSRQNTGFNLWLKSMKHNSEIILINPNF